MKRNEKILVYGVTGFLCAILVIAVVFGNEDLTLAKEGRGNLESSRTLDEILASAGTESTAADTQANQGLQGDQGEATTGQGEEGQTAAEGPPTDVDEEQSEDPSQLIGPLPLAARTAEVVSVLGKSRREGDYRVVAIQPRDTFNGLVQRWCGGLELESAVERLNESMSKNNLQPGVEMWFPWIEDDVLMTAYEERQAMAREQATREPVAAEASTRTAGRLYTLQRGDSLWKLAEAAAGLGGAPAYIEQIKALNPDIPDFDRLQAGQQIRIPRD